MCISCTIVPGTFCASVNRVFVVLSVLMLAACCCYCSINNRPMCLHACPSLQLLFDHQLNSIRLGAERTLFTESPAPHFVVRRYAALAASMLLLMAEYDGQTPGEGSRSKHTFLNNQFQFLS